MSSRIPVKHLELHLYRLKILKVSSLFSRLYFYMLFLFANIINGFSGDTILLCWNKINFC